MKVLFRNRRLAGLAAAALIAAAPATARAQEFINVLTGGTSGVYYPLGVALSKIYGEKIQNVRPTVQATKASVENLQLLQQGKGEIAFTLGDSLDAAWKGDEEAGFKAPLKKLRGITAIYPNYIQIVASKDSGIKTLADLKGKKLGFADPDSTSGYLVPNVSLPKEIGAPVKEYFSETGFGGGHENLVLAVLDGKFDAGTTFGSGVGNWEEGYSAGNLHQMVAKGNLDMDDIVEVWRSPLIPNGPLMVSNKLDGDMKGKVEAFFKELPKKDLACFQAYTQGKNTDYIEVDPSFYQTIVDARKSVIGG